MHLKQVMSSCSQSSYHASETGDELNTFLSLSESLPESCIAIRGRGSGAGARRWGRCRAVPPVPRPPRAPQRGKLAAARRGLRVNQEFEVDPLERADIASVMQTHSEPIDANASLASVATRLGLEAGAQSHSDALIVVDADNTLIGILTRSDVLRAQSESATDPLTAYTICTTDVARAYPDETVREAAR